MKRQICIMLIMIAACAGLLCSTKVVAQSTESVTLSESTVVSRVYFKEVQGIVCTPGPPAPTEFRDIPGMSLTINISGVKPQVVIVEFTGAHWAFSESGTENNGGSARIQLLADNDKFGPITIYGSKRIMDTPPQGVSAGYNFIVGKLDPGLHVLKIQWLQNLGTNVVCIGRRSMIAFTG